MKLIFVWDSNGRELCTMTQAQPYRLPDTAWEGDTCPAPEGCTGTLELRRELGAFVLACSAHPGIHLRQATLFEVNRWFTRRGDSGEGSG